MKTNKGSRLSWMEAGLDRAEDTMRMAGQEPGVPEAIAMGLAALGISVPGIYSTVDLFTGDANMLNSGEWPMNSAIGGLHGIATGAGLIGGIASSPGFLASVSEAQADAELDAIRGDMRRRDQQRGRRPLTQQEIAELMEVAQSAKDRQREVDERINQTVKRFDKSANPATPQEARAILDRMAARRGLYGAAAGAVLGAVPAVMMMMDQPAQQGRV